MDDRGRGLKLDWSFLRAILLEGDRPEGTRCPERTGETDRRAVLTKLFVPLLLTALMKFPSRSGFRSLLRERSMGAMLDAGTTSE